MHHKRSLETIHPLDHPEAKPTWDCNNTVQPALGESRCKWERITHLVKIILAPFGVEDGRIVTIVTEMAGSYQSITTLKLSVSHLERQ